MHPPPLLLLLLALLPVLRCAVLLPCDAASLAVSTVAGCGGACTAFQGATPLASSLTTPSGLSASPAGTLYIADSGAHTVRALNLTSGAWVGGGWNVTSARAAGYAEGALAGAARFRTPLDVAYSPCTGVVYVADSENHVLRVLTPVNATTVLSSLLAGNPGASGSLAGVGTGANFDKPLGLALSPSCALLYVSDGGNAIKVVHLGTRNVTTLAGSGNGGSINGVGTAAQFYQPQKLVLDATGTLLRFGNRYGYDLRTIDLRSLATSTLATVHPTNLQPSGVFIDAANTTYFTDVQANLVCAYNASAALYNLSTVAGGPSGTCGSGGGSGFADGSGAVAVFNRPVALAAWGGALYVADANNERVRRLACPPPSTSPTATHTPSPTTTPTSSGTASATPSASPSAPPSPSGSGTGSATPSVSPSAPPTPSGTPSAPPTPSGTPSAPPTPSGTPSARATPSGSPTASASGARGGPLGGAAAPGAAPYVEAPGALAAGVALAALAVLGLAAACHAIARRQAAAESGKRMVGGPEAAGGAGSGGGAAAPQQQPLQVVRVNPLHGMGAL